jgi:hypothetical protein
VAVRVTLNFVVKIRVRDSESLRARSSHCQGQLRMSRLGCPVSLSLSTSTLTQQSLPCRARNRDPRWEPGMGMIPDPRQIGDMDPESRQIGGGTPTHDPRQIGDGDGDRGFRALRLPVLPWAKHLNAGPSHAAGASDSDGAAGLLWSGSLPQAASAPTGKSRGPGFKVFLAARGWASTEDTQFLAKGRAMDPLSV